MLLPRSTTERRKPRTRPAVFVRAAAVIATVVFVTSVALQSSAADTFKPFKLKTLDGIEKSLPDVLGKATLVVFFFPSCRFCSVALPEMHKLHEAYRAQGLSMVWINVIPEEEPLLADWQARHGYSVPVLVGGRSVQKDYKLTMTPTHYLIDSRGGVLLRRAGFQPGDERELERAIQQALAQAR